MNLSRDDLIALMSAVIYAARLHNAFTRIDLEEMAGREVAEADLDVMIDSSVNEARDLLGLVQEKGEAS